MGRVGVCMLLKRGGREGERGTYPPAAYGFRQGAGTERSTIWVSHSRPATRPQSTGSTLCFLVPLAANLAQSLRQAPGPFCCLSFSSLSVVARFCQPHRLILGTGWLPALLFLSLGLPAKLSHSARGLSLLSDWRCPS